MKCTICEKELFGLICQNRWCGEVHEECPQCKNVFNRSDIYEYRGAISCNGCFDEVSQDRDIQRAEIIKEESAKTEVFKGLDLTDSVIGRANKEILKPNIEIAAKESFRINNYERGDI